MLRAFFRRSLFGAFVVAAAALFLFAATPASAQTGAVKGRVLDEQGEPVNGAKITIQSVDSSSRKYETKSNRKGEFFQIGLSPGNYKVTAEKDKMVQSFDVRVRLGDPIDVKFVLVPGAGPATREEAAKLEAQIRGAFDEGVALSSAGKNEEAIAKFNEVIAIAPKCASCYANIGSIHLRVPEVRRGRDRLQAGAGDRQRFHARLYGPDERLQRAAEVRPGPGDGRAGRQAHRDGGGRRQR
jgi:hypothetical protein